MGVLERWRAKRAERRKKELQLQKDLAEAKRARQAADRVIKRHSTTAAGKAINYAQLYVGTIEDPGRPNRGPQVDKWQRAVDMIGQPWCGAFAFCAVRAGGVKGLSWRMRYTPYIVDDARRGVNGMLKLVPLNEARVGDLLLYNWDGGAVDHVGLFLSRDKFGIHAIEGNTTSGSAGDQSNGGGVWRRTRQPNQVQYVARPRYPA